MKEYNYKEVEAKWQKKWEEDNLYKTADDLAKKKWFILDMFPYPSGEGLHTGHTRIYTASDIYARMKRMQGYNVLHPTGWDAFGLPAEQFALKHKVHPKISTEKNINNFRRQMKMLALSYDFNREVNTTDPAFYKWSQWIFLKLYEKGLAFESHEPINWCPSCQTGLANEDLEHGKCERCGSEVEKKPMRQWVLRITEYADRLVNDLDTLTEWPEWLKALQKNWIGKSEGSEFVFKLEGGEGIPSTQKIFTTRADTLFGATFVAISAELALSWIKNGWSPSPEIRLYINEVIEDQKKDHDYSHVPEKTGIFSGVYAINPANQEKIPVWIANYVLGDVGTGALMAVPAHDERDWDFAKKYNLLITEVIRPEFVPSEYTFYGPYTIDGWLFNSGAFNDLTSEKAREKITETFGGKKVTRYKLEDWVFSRQRYWGEPIPMVHDKDGKAWPLDESELPLVLPEVDSYEPNGSGESPLANITEWVNVKGYITEKGTFKQKDDGEQFKRETNTMPQWAGSSWYYLRFADPHNEKEVISRELEKYWQPVDVYVGGAEHATRHLIYARFWHKFLKDIGVVTRDEPFMRVESVGLVLGEGGVKMSKRLGNIVNPDDVVAMWGVDVLRVYVAFMGAFYDATAWNPQAIVGCARFLERFWKAQTYVVDEEVNEVNTLLHKTIKKVTEDIDVFKFNTAVSAMMIFLNKVEEVKKINSKDWEAFVLLMAPFAPHMTEELLAEKSVASVHVTLWPKADESKIIDAEATIVLQINGKVRGTFTMASGVSDQEVLARATETEEYKKYVGASGIQKVIVVQNRLINIVI